MLSAKPPATMRKWFQQVSPDREKLLAISWMRPIAHRLTEPTIWHFNRHCVARGVALGLAVSFVLPVGQIVLAALFASMVRGNVLVAAAATLPSNPLTFPAIYYGAYKLGAWLLGTPVTAPAVAADRSMSEMIVGASGPVSLGLIIFAVASAILGYWLVHGVWRLFLVRQWRRRPWRGAAA
ncbi:DUF2062 domain-containing protein [Sphingomonas mesophila]|uniref:DUF2062 domain-containing protein n=1 Tax=Sphingomonas mesophila TaxID=2303576 RepID=UPI001F07B0F6|nr:DUF2062 domain-containing protein [Sphingomonas mesophila]